LPRRCSWLVLESLQVWEELLAEKGKKVAPVTVLQSDTLRSFRRGPVPPAVWGGKRWLERLSDGSSLFLLLLFLLIEDTQEQHPREFRHILHRACAL